VTAGTPPGECAFENRASTVEFDHVAIGEDGDAEFQEVLLDAILLQGIDGPRRSAIGGRDQRHLESRCAQLCGNFRPLLWSFTSYEGSGPLIPAIR
jgi:hypothetical protein